MYFFIPMRHQDGWIICSLLRFCFHVTSVHPNLTDCDIIFYKSSEKSSWNVTSLCAVGGVFFFFFCTGTVASCRTSIFTWSESRGPCFPLLHPASMWAEKWPSSSSNTAKVPFQLLVWKHLGPGGEGADRGDHLNISSSASLAFSASLLLPLNPPLKVRSGGGLSHSNSKPPALPAFCPPPRQQFLLQKP